MMNVNSPPFANTINVELVKLLHKGKWANANVYRFRENGQYMVRKGFCRSPAPIRWTFGAFFIWREIAILKRLSGITGVPQDCRCCRGCALCYRYIEGETLGEKWKKRELIPKSYFIEAENLISLIHARKIVHLDLRRGTNWLVTPDGRPAIIDYQSAISVALLPCKLQNFLFAVDYSGVYKFWKRLCEDPLDSKRAALLEKVNRFRKLWIFKGYLVQKFLKSIRRK